MSNKILEKKLKFLQIGLGSMGKRRIRNLFINHQRNIIGYDISPNRRQEAETNYGIRTISSLQETSINNFDVLIISTPPDQHGDYIRLALRTNKHFFVEHPTSDNGYKEIFSKKYSSTVKAPSCTLLFYRPIKLIKKLLEKGSIGKILAFQYHDGQYLPDWHPYEDYRKVYFSKKNTGACREMLPFELIWLNWIFNSEIKEISGSSNKLSKLEIDADDIIFAEVKYKNGILGNIIIDVISRKPFKTLRVLGSDGVLEWEKSDRCIKIYTPPSKKVAIIKVREGQAERGYINEEEMYNNEIKNFLEAIIFGKLYPHTFKDSQHVLNVLYALEKCSQSGKRSIII